MVRAGHATNDRRDGTVVAIGALTDVESNLKQSAKIVQSFRLHRFIHRPSIRLNS
jgi:hypothetical protein